MAEPKNLRAVLRVDAEQRLETLKQRFPSQFERLVRADWPPGWNELVWHACAIAAQQCFDVQWEVIGEKWGGLRCVPFYPQASDQVWSYQAFRARMQEIDQVSQLTCARCSEPGTRVKVSSWVIALCPRCATEFNARPLPVQNPD